jgi:hypothetical protein
VTRRPFAPRTQTFGVSGWRRCVRGITHANYDAYRARVGLPPLDMLGLGQGRLKSVAAQRRRPYGTWMQGAGGVPPSKPRRWRRSDGSRSGGRVALRKRAGASFWIFLWEARLERWIACPGRTNGGSKHLRPILPFHCLRAFQDQDRIVTSHRRGSARARPLWRTGQLPGGVDFCFRKGTATPPRLATLLIFAQGVFAVCASLVLAATILFRAVWRELGHSERRRGLPDRARFRRR